MKIEDKKYGDFILTTETETLEDIAIAVIMASYELAGPFGYGFMRNYETELTKEKAKAMLNGEDISKDYPCNRNKKNEVYMDYVFGRCCKTKISLLENCVEIRISERDRNPKKILKRVKEILKEKI